MHELRIFECKRKFHTIDLMTIKQQLDKMSEKDLVMLNGVNFKDPTVALIFSVVVSEYGGSLTSS